MQTVANHSARSTLFTLLCVFTGQTEAADRGPGCVGRLCVEAVRAAGHRLGAGPAGPDPAGRPTHLVFGAERACVLRLLAGLYLEELLAGSPPIASAVLPGETNLFSPLGHSSPEPLFGCKNSI